MPSNQNLNSHLIHAIAAWNCWAAEAGDCCSKHFYKLLDVKHAHAVISFVSTSAKLPTTQPDGHNYEDTVLFQPIASCFPSCFILASWKTECHRIQTHTPKKGSVTKAKAANVLLVPNRGTPLPQHVPPLPRRAAPGSQRPRLCKGRAPRPAPLPPGDALTGPPHRPYAVGGSAGRAPPYRESGGEAKGTRQAPYLPRRSPSWLADAAPAERVAWRRRGGAARRCAGRSRRQHVRDRVPPAPTSPPAGLEACRCRAARPLRAAAKPRGVGQWRGTVVLRWKASVSRLPFSSTGVADGMDCIGRGKR